MLSAQSRPYIDASVPVLRAHGEAITRRFYANLFLAHPALKNMFNMANQASGVQQQSLAAAVFAYAANIDNADALAPVIARIVHKHVSLGVRAEHYPIVGEFLLGAIQEVLGEAATPALIDAWAEAYGLLADHLIETERELYASAGIAAGAMFAMRVHEAEDVGGDVRSFLLVNADGSPVPSFKPGQYVSVAIDFDDGHRQLRQYSLSAAPDVTYLRISVKRERAGDAGPAGEVSAYLHDRVQVGSELQVSAPFGEFTPDVASERPIVLLSSGIGITPMVSVLNQIVRQHPERRVLFAHANGGHHFAHRRDLEAAAVAMPNLQAVVFVRSAEARRTAPGDTAHKSHKSHVSNVSHISHVTPNDADADVVPPVATRQGGIEYQAGALTVAALPDWPLLQSSIYLCGSRVFLRELWADMIDAGVDQKQMHREVFGPELLEGLLK